MTNTRRFSDYTSDNPLDVDPHHRTADREEIAAGASYRLSKAWAAQVKYTRTNDDPADDDAYWRTGSPCR